MYYLEDLRENTTAASPPLATLLLPSPEQSFSAQKPSQDTEVPVGAEKEKNGAVVASQIEEKAKEKEKG